MINEAKSTARRAADARPMGWAARLGLVARGLVYLLVGLLAWSVARGANHELDQKGALAQVLDHPYGRVLVVLIAIGLYGYALWRLSEAAFGVTGEPPGAGPRIASLVRGIVYLALAVTATSLLRGSNTSQASQQQEITARIMHHTGGRWLIGIVGIAIALTGLYLAWQGLRLKFMRYFPEGPTSPSARKVIRVLGAIGNVARGLVFTLVGFLVLMAAVRYEPQKARGLDGALKTLRDQPYGPYLLGAVALGLVAFGLYGLAEAKYRRV
jgi:hypothetical protein